MNIKNIAQYWEQRSTKYAFDPQGVLPKFLSKQNNAYLDNWMYKSISLDLTKENELSVLDLGCGYGRLSEQILQHFPKSKVSGIDISHNYVALYNKKLKPRGNALVGSITKLPYQDKAFDMVFMVTTLMYLSERSDQIKALKEINRVLKPGGKFVIIERNSIGNKIVTLGGLIGLVRGKKNREIPAVDFTQNSFNSMLSVCNLGVSANEGIPTWTICLPILIITSYLSPYLTDHLLKLIQRLDSLLKNFTLTSLYIVYRGSKK